MTVIGMFLAQAKPASPPASGGILMIGVMLAMIVFFFVSSRSNKRAQAQRRQLLDNLKKNDRVVTVGGVLGTVMNVKENEVVVKVDEATNTRMTFLKKSIQQVVTGDEDLNQE